MAKFRCQTLTRARLVEALTTGKWKATIMADGKSHPLGLYPTAEEASAAYVAAKHRLHPEWVEGGPLLTAGGHRG